MSRPSVGLSMPAMRWRRVDLPEPEGPMRATNSPRETETWTLSRARTSTCPRRKILVRWRAWTMGSDMGASGVGAGI